MLYALAFLGGVVVALGFILVVLGRDMKVWP
jgi:hypothetical protein